MISVVLFLVAIFAAILHSALRKERCGEIFLRYLLLLNMGLMGFLAAYAHVFMGPQIAEQIGWEPGSPFQFEIGMANLSYAVLGVLSFWINAKFRAAAIIGWSVLLLGCFVGHIYNYATANNTSPLNIGIFVWFNDLFLPLLALGLLVYLRKDKETI